MEDMNGLTSSDSAGGVGTDLTIGRGVAESHNKSRGHRCRGFSSTPLDSIDPIG